MRRSVRAVPRTAFVALLAVLIAVAVVVGIVVSSHGGKAKISEVSPTTSRTARSGFVAIPTSDGLKLAALVVAPKGAGPFPLIVMPASWGAGVTEYTAPAEKFARAGYLVVAYAQRGFGGSGGTVDFAGTATRDDVSTVIDWALAHTPADPKRIGALGVSYGAGISLLAAAHDKRIRAVVAMSGWSDMAQAVAPNSTPNLEALRLLFGGKYPLSGPIAQVAARMVAIPQSVDELVAALSPSRSPDAEVADLNRNDPAIMLANAYEDSILSPTSLVPFFTALTTPKRLQLAPGDHTGPEHAGLLGEPDTTFIDAAAWLDHYLRGASNQIVTQDPIQLQDGVTGVWHGYRSWPASSETAYLGPPDSANDIASSDALTWQHSISTGTDTTAVSGPASSLAPAQYRAPETTISSVSPQAGFVWTGPALGQATAVSGTPAVRVGLGASSPASTVFAYLYDVDPAGTGKLMTYAPDTVSSRAGAATVTLRPVSWTVAAGHHLALVIDSVDARYRSAAPAGSTITLSSTPDTPATLSIPFG